MPRRRAGPDSDGATRGPIRPGTPLYRFVELVVQRMVSAGASGPPGLEEPGPGAATTPEASSPPGEPASDPDGDAD